MAKKKTQNQESQSAMVRKSTFALAVATALVVGFYLGFVFSGMQRAERDAPPPQAAVQAPGAAAPAPPQTPPPGPGPDRIRELERKTVENPTSAAAWADLGNAYFDSNQPLEAVQAYEHSLELDPMNAMVWTDLGVMQRRSGRPEKAVEAFDRASRLDPKLEQPRFNKGIVLLHDLSDRAGAVQAWEELLAMNPAAVTPMGGPLRDMVEEIKRGGQ